MTDGTPVVSETQKARFRAAHNETAKTARALLSDGEPRISITGVGPAWHNFHITYNGEVIPCLSFTVDVDPHTGKCQATIVIADYMLDVYDMPVQAEVVPDPDVTRRELKELRAQVADRHEVLRLLRSIERRVTGRTNRERGLT